MELNATLIINQMLFGLALGAVYILMACGLTIIFGLLDVVNFAHGTYYMLGAFAAFVIVSLFGNFWVGLASAVIIVGPDRLGDGDVSDQAPLRQGSSLPPDADLRDFLSRHRPDARNFRDDRADRSPPADFFGFPYVGRDFYSQIPDFHHLSNPRRIDFSLVSFSRRRIWE